MNSTHSSRFDHTFGRIELARPAAMDPPGASIRSPSRSPRHSPRHSPSMRRRRCSINKKMRERQEFFRKYSPLSISPYTLPFGTEQPSTNSNISKESRPYILDPTGKQAYRWLVVITVAVIYYGWTIILRVSFQDVQHQLIWILLDSAFYVIYILDVLLQMRTSYLRDGILEDDVKKVRMFYMSTWRFKVDVLSILPLDWLYTLLTMSHAPAALQIFRLLKIYRLRQFFDRTESRSHFPNLCRVLFLVHNVLVIIHWNACIYFLVSQWLGLGSDGWVYKASNETHNVEWGYLSRRYIYCFYWSTLTLTTIGELPEPQQNVEYVIVTLDYLIGILMFATLVGNIGSIIANVQKNRTKFQAKMDQIKHYMKETKVPNHLQERVIKWFDYLWTHGLPVEDQQALNGLPDKLKAEIGIHVHFETLKKVDFFEECEQGLLWELVLRLRTQIYSPGEYVCRKGDVGREMYIVNSGRLEVSAEQNSEVFRKLLHGEYFGEISVLNLGKSQHRRTVFVRSVGYTQLLCLSQSDLLEVLNDYPRTKDTLIMKGKMKLENTSTVNEDPPQIITNDKEADLSTDSEDSSEVSSELQLQTVADQVMDVNIRLSQMESLLKEIVHEIQKNGYNTRNHASPMKSTQL